jgi:hypothetical protein
MIEAIIGFVGVIVGSVITLAHEIWRSHTHKEKTAHYSAIRITGVLDEYFHHCVDVAFDDGTSEGRPAGRTDDGQEFYEAQVICPKAPAYSEDVDWKSLPNDLTYEILSLSSLARDTDRFIDASAEHAFPPDYREFFEARQIGYAKIGLEVFALIAKLRDKYSLPEKNYAQWNPDWKPEQRLKELITKRTKEQPASNILEET